MFSINLVLSVCCFCKIHYYVFATCRFAHIKYIEHIILYIIKFFGEYYCFTINRHYE